MNKNITKITHIINILLIISMCIFIIFFSQLYPYDELWNFQNVFKISNGFKIYQDANVIITPLFFYIESFLLKIFGANFLVFRTSSIILFLLFYFLVYKIQKNLKINKNINLLFTLILSFCTYKLYVVNGANYNVLALLFYLIGLNAYISEKNSNIFQGIIIFLIFMTKQSTAFFYILAIIIYELYKYKFSKKFFINQLKKLVTFLIPTLIYILILYIDNNLTNFISYTFGGLLDFSKNNFTFSQDVYDMFIIFLTYGLSISMLFCKKSILNKTCSEDFFNKLVLLIVFTTCSGLTLYPIFNQAHTKMILSFFFIILAYIFDTFFLEIINDEKSQKIMYILITILLSIFCIKVCTESLLDSHFNQTQLILEQNNPLFGARIECNNVEESSLLQNYVIDKNSKGIDVIICSSKSAFVMVPLKQSHGAYDLIFYGNLGYNGIEKMKQDILSRNYTEFLVLKNEDDMFRQEITEIRDFIINNLTKYGEFLNYDVYVK